MARDFRGMVNFSLRSTVAELQGVKVAQFSDFGLLSPYKTPKMYERSLTLLIFATGLKSLKLLTSLQPRGYIAE